MPGAVRFLLGEQLRGDRAGLLPVADFGEVLLLDGVLPLRDQLREREPQDPGQGTLDAPEPDRRLGDLADGFVAPPLPDIGDERVPEAVREHAVERLGARELAFERRIPKPHGRVGIHRSDGEILGHPFGEPQRRVRIDDALHAADAAAARPDIELELVHHLVHEDVLVLFVRADQREDVPVTEEVGEAAGAFVDFLSRRVRLLELGVRSVRDDRLALLELVGERPGKPRVGALRHPRDVQGRFPGRRVVVHIEVLGLDDPEVEAAVLDPVAPEVLGIDRGGEDGEQQSRSAEATHHDEFLSTTSRNWGASVQSRSRR